MGRNLQNDVVIYYRTIYCRIIYCRERMEILNKFAMWHYRTKQDYAYETIREAIVTGEMAPGERLIISNIASELGVSEIPVREALKRLQTEGLITRSGYGFAVASISLEDFVELLGVRLELEGMAIRRSTERIGDQELKEIENLLTGMEEANRLKDSTMYGRLDKELHTLLLSFCGVDVLKKAIHDASAQSERARAIFRIMPFRAETSLKEHWEIFEAIKQRNAKLAEELLIKHKRQAFDLFIQQVMAHPQNAGEIIKTNREEEKE